jgi:DNA-binding GntR family transcriptional regulator
VALDAEFHMMFCEFLGNREILNVMGQLRREDRPRHRAGISDQPGRVRTSYDEHLAIAEAVISGDGATAARLVEHHLEVGSAPLSPRRG